MHIFSLFTLPSTCLRRLLLNEKIEFSSWNVDCVLKTAWKWNSWSLIRDGRNVSFISDFHVRFLSFSLFGDVAFLVSFAKSGFSLLIRTIRYVFQHETVSSLHELTNIKLTWTSTVTVSRGSVWFEIERLHQMMCTQLKKRQPRARYHLLLLCIDWHVSVRVYLSKTFNQ